MPCVSATTGRVPVAQNQMSEALSTAKCECGHTSFQDAFPPVALLHGIRDMGHGLEVIGHGLLLSCCGLHRGQQALGTRRQHNVVPTAETATSQVVQDLAKPTPNTQVTGITQADYYPTTESPPPREP